MSGMVPRYDLVESFAQGGMAELSIARSHSGHLSIVKRMRADADNRRTRRMFRDEIRITASMSHPNVVEVRDCNTAIGDDYLVMEYVRGVDVRKLLAHAARTRDPIPLDVAISIVAAAAAGLHHAHELRGFDGSPFHIVHRDVSPTNILVGYDGQVKVIDFGIAKASFTREEPGLVKGKTSYLSPEQVLGQPIDRRTDIFSLGIVLFELVTATRLFRRSEEHETLQAIACGVIPSVTKRRADCPAELEAAIFKALELLPENRYQTADDLRVALLQILGRDGDAIAERSIAACVTARFQ